MLRPSPRVRGFRVLLTAAVAALALGACSDDGVAPLPADVSTATVAAGDGPSLHRSSGGPRYGRNRDRYRDSDRRHGRHHGNRAGSASLQARALVGEGDTTWLTVTTGDLDDLARAPGEIAKLQVKIFSPDGDHLATLNRHELNGTGSVVLPFTGIVPGSVFRVQANVRGIDRRRTDVVTVTDTASFGPLLEARLSVPEQVVVGSPTVITATVSELRGQVGARTDCVLVVDGSEVDRAKGIWVDAGDAVSCAFTHTFDRAGGHEVQVLLVDESLGATILAGDFTTADVVAVTPSAVAYTATAEDRIVSSSTWIDYHWENPVTGGRREYADFDVRTERTQSVSVQATLSRAALFPLLSVRLTFGSGSIVWTDDTFTGLVALTDLTGRTCANRQETPLSALIFVCSTAAGTTFGYTRFGGTVTYHSDGFSRNFDGPALRDVFTWNDTYTEYAGGEQVRPWGDDVRVGITVTDGLGTFSAAPVIPLAAREQVLQAVPRSCVTESPWWLDGGAVESCNASEVREVVRSGSTQG